MNANEILAIGNEIIISKKKGNKGIYKESLFKNLSEKEKKSLRIKLRRKTNNFIGTFLQVEKNPTELKKLVASWKKYANEVYKNTEIIFDSNANKESMETVKRFINAMK